MTKQPLTPRNQTEGSKRSPTATPNRASGTSSTRRTATMPPPAAIAPPPTKPSSSRRKTKTVPVAAVPAAPLATLTTKPSFWRTLREDPNALRNLHERLPVWIDEVVALLLMGLGGVAFASLLSQSGGDGALAGNLSHFLRQWFGNGAYLIALGILGVGILILLPKLGLRVRFSLGQIIAAELTLASLQGLLHGLAFESEAYALAREGGGGGYIGWGVNYIFASTVGEPANIVILGVILLIGLHWLAGISRQTYRNLVTGFSDQLQNMAQRLDPEVAPQPIAVPVTPAPIAASPRRPTAPVMVTEAVPAVYEIPEPVTVMPPKNEPSFTAPVSAPSPVATTIPPLPATPMQPRQPSKSDSNRRKSIVPRPDALPSENPITEPMRQPTASAGGRTMPPPPIPQVAPLAPRPLAPIAEVQQPISSPPFEMQAVATLEAVVEAETDGEEIIPVEVPITEGRPALVVNGQVIDPTQITRERPSIVPRNGNGQELLKPTLAPTPKTKHQGGRDDNPNKRYFTVADFAERKKHAKREDYLPPLEILHDYDLFRPDESDINLNASIIENTLLEFDLDADVIDVKVGPVVTQYAVSPIKQVVNPKTGEMEINRIRVDRITSLQGDLALALSAKTLRIEAPVPGHSYVGIEVPNRKASVVGLRGVMESEKYHNKRAAPLAVPLGRDVSGESIIMQLATLPHMLVAGTTGSGKSVFLTATITSLIMNNHPDQVKLILLDPKRVELTRFNGIPHLIGPVETEADRIIGVLRWATREMDRRYKLMELENARNLDVYNASLGKRRKDEHLPYIVIVFDEIGDLMMSHPDETEGAITRLAQKARAAGMHLVIATQRPSTDILTGLIKANCPGRLSFAVASGVDSRVILDYSGAETLLGRGDMLYLAPDAAGPVRVQGCFVSDEELEAVVSFWQNWTQQQVEAGKIEIQRTPPWERGMTRLESLSEQDVLLEEAITIICEAGEASTSLIQRRLGVGYPRAAHLMDMMFELGIIGPPKTGGRARSVLVTNPKQALKKMQNKK